MLFLRFAAHCVSLLCLRCSLFGHAFPIYAMPLLIEAKHFVACPFVALSLLVLCKANLRISRLFLCSTAQRNAVPLHCRQSRASPLPRCSKLCNALAVRQDSLPGAALPSHCLTLLFLCHATPRRCFSSLCPASRFLCSSSPINSFAGRFTAMMSPCKSLYCSANPLQINSWLCAAFALLCHSQLFPCAAVQETSAQRKRPLPELRHWPRPR